MLFQQQHLNASLNPALKLLGFKSAVLSQTAEEHSGVLREQIHLMLLLSEPSKAPSVPKRKAPTQDRHDSLKLWFSTHTSKAGSLLSWMYLACPLLELLLKQNYLESSFSPFSRIILHRSTSHGVEQIHFNCD